DTRYRLGFCLHKMHKDAEALQWLGKCPPLVPVRLAQAQCLFGLGREQEARDLLDGVLADSPDNAPALLLAAEMALRRQDASSTAAFLERAVRAAPANTTIRYQLAAIYRRLGREEEARHQREQMDEIKLASDEYENLSQQAAKAANDPEIRCRLGKL